MSKSRLAIVLAGLVSIFLLTSAASSPSAIASVASKTASVTTQIPQATPGPIMYANATGLWIKVTKWPSKDSTLSGIAAHYLGSASKWPNIYRDSHNRIANPNILQVGQRLWVPKGKPTTASSPQKAPTKTTTTAVRGWSTPVAFGYSNVTSCFGMRWGKMHQGLDISRPYGTPIRAPQAGTIKQAGWWSRGYGISVLLFAGGSRYFHMAHMSKTIVKPGQRVKAGQILGYVGSTGDSTGNHLHFEVWSGMWNQINPVPWLRSHGITTGYCR